MISEKIVKHIAKLARLKLSEKEIKKLQKELSSILDYIEKLKEIEVSGVEPFAVKLENVFRKDLTKTQPIEKSQKLIEMSPERKKNYIKTKPVLK